MSIALFSLENVQLGASLEVSNGPLIWVPTYEPNGVGVFNPADGSLHISPASNTVTGAPLVANGYVWTGWSDGSQSGIYNRPLIIPPAKPFENVGPTFHVPWSLRALERANDGSIWVSLYNQSTKEARLECIAVLPPGRGPNPPSQLGRSVVLSFGRHSWDPLYISAGREPGFMYIVAQTGGNSSVFARKSLDDDTGVETLFEFPAGLGHGPLRTTNGAFWFCGLGTSGGDNGWLVCYDPQTPQPVRVWHDQTRYYAGIAEGENERMFLLRSTGLFSGGIYGSDILEFKLSPIGGLGPVTHITQPVFSMNLIADIQGAFWFKTQKRTTDPNVFEFGLGRFVPPKNDPLNP